MASLLFSPLESSVSSSFWTELARLKLDELRLSELPLEVFGASAAHNFIAPRSCGAAVFCCCSLAAAQGPCQQQAELSLPRRCTWRRPACSRCAWFCRPCGATLAHCSPAQSQSRSQTDGRFNVPGTLLVVNTRDTFDSTDRAALLCTAATQLWNDVTDGSAERDPSRLARFVLLAFPDLKAFTFRYWFAFPALKLAAPITCSAVAPLQAAYTAQECSGVARACCSWLQAGHSAFAWLVFVPANGSSEAEAHSLEEWAALASRTGRVALAMADPSNLPTNPGWPLRNLLVLACARWGCSSLRVIAVRGEPGRVNPQLTIVLDTVLPSRAAAFAAGGVEAPAAVGWERDIHGQLGPRVVDLRGCLDPREQAEQATDLNLKLMRWRLFPALDVERLSATRCMLIGAGTLGCAVARTLLAWGVRHITLVDSGSVAFSNPVRQSLFEFEDCLSGGRPKAVVAAEKLQRIFPGAVTRGVVLRVPMPGHAVLPQEAAAVSAEVAQLDALVADSDVCFILTDTRESRWLPTLQCVHHGKLAINAALGFDSFLVMRHGFGAATESADVSAAVAPRCLGCYFCTDVVAPVDSTVNRTLDQQCTVSRPGLAPMAAALAVELAVSVLHHPEGARAGGSASGALGTLPHQIRGNLSTFEQRVFEAPAFRQCTACSPAVTRAYSGGAEARWRFLLAAFCDGKSLEELTGLSQLHASADAGWDEMSDDEGGEL